MKWGYAQNYHLTLNSGVLGIDQVCKNHHFFILEISFTLHFIADRSNI